MERKRLRNQPKWSPRWSKIDPRRELKEKTGKVWKRTTLRRFCSMLGVYGGRNSKKKQRKRCWKRFKIGGQFRSSFFKDLLIVGPFWGPRSIQNRRKRASKRKPIFNRSCMVVLLRSSLGHCRPTPPGAPHNTRPIFPKKTIGTQRMKGRLETNQRTKRMKGSCPGSVTPQAKSRANYM